MRKVETKTNRHQGCLLLLWVMKIFLLFLIINQTLSASTSWWKNPDTDPHELSFSLLTISPGEAVHERFGHNLLRVSHRSEAQSFDINWGMFPFQDPFFLWKFFRGVLPYEVVMNSTYLTSRTYKNRADVWLDEIHLTPSQKKKLWKQILWNLRPENRLYSYQYFFDNCSTRIRDYLDTALDGKIRKTFDSTQTKTVFRNYVRHHLNPYPPIVFLLDFLMNSRIDRPITLWEKMFLPDNLRQYLQQVPVVISGEEIPLLSKGTLLFSGQTDQTTTLLTAAQWFLLVMFFPTILFVFMTFYKKIIGFNLILWINHLTWAGTSGIIGSLMAISWLLSNHLDLHHNVNLWLLWPSDFVWLFFPWIILRKKKKTSLFLWMETYNILHLLSIVAFLVLIYSGLIQQDTGPILKYFLPPYSLFLMISLYHLRSSRIRHLCNENA